jgi:hypothetical protein
MRGQWSVVIGIVRRSWNLHVDHHVWRLAALDSFVSERERLSHAGTVTWRAYAFKREAVARSARSQSDKNSRSVGAFLSFQLGAQRASLDSPFWIIRPEFSKFFKACSPRACGLPGVAHEVLFGFGSGFTPLANDELKGPRGAGYRRMIDLCPAGRAGTPDEVETIGALLMGSDGAFITGSDFLMDGGVTAAYWFGELAPQ